MASALFSSRLVWRRNFFGGNNYILKKSSYVHKKSNFPVPHLDVFWAYRFLEVKDWIVWWYSNPPSSCCSCVFKIIWCSMHLGKDMCASCKFFVLKYSQTIFYSVFTWNIYRKSFTRTFWGSFFCAHAVQTVLKYIWMRHWFRRAFF